MIALIDGDVVCYLACSNENLGITWKSTPEDFTENELELYFEKAWQAFKKIISEIEDQVFATETLIAVKGEGNFREDVYPEYKANRHKRQTVASLFVPRLRETAILEGAVPAHGREADDLIRIWALEAKDPFIVCSIDKDLKCIEGAHYNIKKKEIEFVEKEQAIRFYYEQLLKGDPTDNIQGLPKVGDVRARKMLENCKHEEEMQEVVAIAYLNHFGKDHFLDALLLTGKLIHLQKSFDDYFCCKNWSIMEVIWEFH